MMEDNQFAAYAHDWWNLDGPLKTLHDLNPLRVAYIQQHAALSSVRVLDIGCGGGILSEALARAGAQVTGLDIEPGAIATAQQHALQEGLAIDYYTTPVEQYQPDELFDVIVCMEMLEHVAHPLGVLEQAARLLKPGGYLFLSTLNRTLKAYAMAIVGAEYILGILPRQTHDYHQFIRPSELTALVRTVGCELVDLTGVSYNPWSRVASRCRSLDVNYLLTAQRVL
jgi:2-polyprenyl-6-hydroxyphenyl methylase/3-demethylubiquinone-9 3-methyltransferase